MIFSIKLFQIGTAKVRLFFRIFANFSFDIGINKLADVGDVEITVALAS